MQEKKAPIQGSVKPPDLLRRATAAMEVLLAVIESAPPPLTSPVGKTISHDTFPIIRAWCEDQLRPALAKTIAVMDWPGLNGEHTPAEQLRALRNDLDQALEKATFDHPDGTHWLLSQEDPAAIVRSWARAVAILYSYYKGLKDRVRTLQALLADTEKQLLADSMIPVRNEAADSGREMKGYCFSRVGDTWEVTFGGEHARGLKDAIGMKYIRTLLQHPNHSESISSLTLQGAPATPGANRLSEDERASLDEEKSRQEILSPEAVEDYKQRLDQIKKEIAEARETIDVQRQEQLESEKEKILDELRLATGKFRSQRKMGRSPAERAAEAVGAAIRRARDHLRKKGVEKLADHLEKSIRRNGTGFTYRPGPKPPLWSL